MVIRFLQRKIFLKISAGKSVFDRFVFAAMEQL